MELIRRRWQQLDEVVRLAGNYSRIQVWLFGSALRSGSPSDIDVLLVYHDRRDVVAIREACWWTDYDPPLNIIAMTRDEEREYDFIAATHAVRLR